MRVLLESLSGNFRLSYFLHRSIHDVLGKASLLSIVFYIEKRMRVRVTLHLVAAVIELNDIVDVYGC